MQNVSDNSHPLDEKLVFANTEVKKNDYASRRLPYSLEQGTTDAWDELANVLYSPEELDKIEWAIGAIVSGDSKRLQKFLVFYGPAGSGKSTILNIIHNLFDGYVSTFDAKALGSSNAAFATEVFKSNPLVAIQHDGDLSRIDDNTKLNSIISHETMTMNEKYKPSYSARVNAFLLMGTNQPVKISDAKSGIIRRLIDVHPTGQHVEQDRYHALMKQIEFEHGAIAYKCLQRYLELGKNYYSGYRPLEMMLQTDVFYNFVESCYDIFKAQDGVTLKQAYLLYKEFGVETGIERLLPQYKFREELRNYFYKFEDKAEVEGVTVRSYYAGFKELLPPSPYKPHDNYVAQVRPIDTIYEQSVFDQSYPDQPAQYGKVSGFPGKKIATIGSGLPKKEKPMLDQRSIAHEKGLRDLIERNLRKEIHPGTKPSIDFISKILHDAYDGDLSYDVRDMRNKILTFALNSSNQAQNCLKIVQKMPFVGKDNMPEPTSMDDKPIVIYDVEVYPNLFVVCWKYYGKGEVVRMINPDANDIEQLLSMRLVGFNNRRYDNHILYARFLGYPVEELYKLSQRIIEGRDSALFGEAYNLSYADIYDFSSLKQGLKKFEIMLGIHHMELDLPWDEPVPKELWPKVVDYCVNDVIATEAVFDSRKADFTARQILADISGLSVNHTTQNHTAKIIFGDDKNPQRDFIYTDLSKEFKGYKFDGKESTYRGEVTGEGGYVYADPGIYENVALLDVASMHPTSIEVLNLFGPYTKNFAALKEARMAIKHKEFDKARTLLDGKLGKFLADDQDAEALAYALKIVINIVYGLTSAKFPNAFRDNRNVDNIVAKRGALFMIDLKHEVQKRGFIVAHIKTDSIKIPNATPEIIKFVTEFGKQYGYDFEHEVTYDKFCLVNDAVYIARAGDKWNAVGAQFQHPYVYKTLFTHEELTFDDFCETKSVTQGSMYLNFTDLSNDPQVKDELHHVGRTGSFVPVKTNGGMLWRIKDDKHYAVTGTKGYLWIEREVAQTRKDLDIDMDYFEALRQAAFEAIDFYGPFEQFVS